MTNWRAVHCAVTYVKGTVGGETYAAQFMPYLKVTCVIALLASCIMLTGTHVYMQYYVPQLNYVLIHTE